MGSAKKLFGGFLVKLGENMAVTCGPFVATALAWLIAPDSVAVSRWLVTAVVAAGATLAFGSYAIGVHRGRRHVGAPRLRRVDPLQISILKLLWAHPHATVKFDVLARMLDQSYNTMRLACERLHARGLVAGNFYDSNTLVQLMNEGREYMDKHGLNERTEHFLLEQFQRAEIEVSQGH